MILEGLRLHAYRMRRNPRMVLDRRHSAEEDVRTGERCGQVEVGLDPWRDGWRGTAGTVPVGGACWSCVESLTVGCLGLICCES